MIALRIAGIIIGVGVGIWGGFKLLAISIEWLKALFENMRPERYRKDRERF